MGIEELGDKPSNTLLNKLKYFIPARHIYQKENEENSYQELGFMLLNVKSRG